MVPMNMRTEKPEKKNARLVGMQRKNSWYSPYRIPSSTVDIILAESNGRPVVDLDAIVVMSRGSTTTSVALPAQFASYYL